LRYEHQKTEEKYGHSEESYKKRKVAAAKDTVRILRRMKDPMEYLSRRRDEVDKKYPEYKSLITKYSDGSTSSSGDFIRQGRGWTGQEAGNDPRRGYFEFANGRFELAASPDQDETDRMLAELTQYYEDISNAYNFAVL